MTPSCELVESQQRQRHTLRVAKTHRDVDVHLYIPLHTEVILFGLKIDCAVNLGDSEGLVGSANTLSLLGKILMFKSYYYDIGNTETILGQSK